MELSIAKEKYKYSNQVKERVSYERWVQYIDANQSYYSWLEETEVGKERVSNIDKIPLAFREGILLQLNKSQALAEFNLKKGYHEIVVDYHGDTGVISITIMKKVIKEHLKEFLNMAQSLDAYLLNHGDEVIDDV